VAVVSSASAGFNSTTLLFDTPTADVLPAGSIAISACVTGPLTQNTRNNVGWWEGDANVRFSPVKHLDFALTAYTLKDYVLDVKYQVVGGEPERFGLAAGVYDIGFYNYVSPIGHGLDDAWPDWKYDEYLPRYDRSPERFSAFVVTSIPVTEFARINIGLGRGRFVGYDDRSKYLNFDIFFNQYHQWAIAVFGGLELYVHPNVALVAEAGSRDINAGVKADFGPISATVAWKKMEGLLFAEGDARFGRIAFGATYKLGPWARPAPPEQPTPREERPPTPEQEPERPPIAQKLRLRAIWFNWDKSDITEAAAGALRGNAEVILSHPEIKAVTISGYASEEGSIEHNLPLSERRAEAAFEYLKALGVPAGLMRTRAMGELAGRPLPLRRAVYFEIEQ
jgi:outer membrane protein OmpA-like peptidoglycan-associated protein